MALFYIGTAHADGRLLATGGGSMVEGAAGGGIVPWAVLTGYATKEESSVTAFYTGVYLSDYDFNSVGAAVNFRNRIEISLAQQTLDIGVLTSALTFDPGNLRQDVVGLKVRLFGDVIFSRWPQVSAGAMYKRSSRFAIPQAVGAVDNSDIDYFLSGTKVFLAGAAGRNLLTNVTLRATRANQIGLLGFGGDKSNSRDVMVEGSIAVLLSKQFAIGYEYRQKPDNLSFAQEDDWSDAFVAWFPNKKVSLIAAYADLGSIATVSEQDGFYLSVQGTF